VFTREFICVSNDSYQSSSLAIGTIPFMEKAIDSSGDSPERVVLNRHVLFIRYVVFAVIAGCANLGVQEIVVRTAPLGSYIIISVLAGTAIGFAVKYILDKNYVFFDAYDGHKAELRKLITYGLFSAGTTLLFWSIELTFWYMFKTPEAKYIGGALGLAIGNSLKYILDRNWVFNCKNA
jgi:putative flippase GtrA